MCGGGSAHAEEVARIDEVARVEEVARAEEVSRVEEVDSSEEARSSGKVSLSEEVGFSFMEVVRLLGSGGQGLVTKAGSGLCHQSEVLCRAVKAGARPCHQGKCRQGGFCVVP